MARALTAQNIGVPDPKKQFASDFDDVSMEELSTPFLIMLQSNSPQVIPDEPLYVDGARVGQICAGSVGELYDEVDMIVCGRNRHYAMWRPRALGKGFLGQLPPEHPLVLETVRRMDAKYGIGSGRFRMPKYLEKERKWSAEPARHPKSDEEIELIETVQLFVRYADTGQLTGATLSDRAIVSFKSASLKAVTHWNDLNRAWVNQQRRNGEEPERMWGIRWRLGTEPAQDAAGNKFRKWKLDLAPPAKNYRQSFYRDSDPELYAQGEEFFDLVSGGKVKVDQEADTSVDPNDPPF